MTVNVLVMAGGTGGHVFPALACARLLREQGYAVHWLGTRRGIESELVPAAGFPIHYVDVQGLRGKSRMDLLKAPVSLLKALRQSQQIVSELKPVFVLGAGGYVTGPGGMAAWMQRIPVVIHEQNAVVGTANRLLATIAARRCEGFPGSFANDQKRRSTGNPVRDEIFQVPAMNWDAGRSPRLLVLGGSLGALPLNRMLPEALGIMDAAKRPEVWHQCGKQHLQLTTEAYKAAGVQATVEPFIGDMAAAYAWADLVACRAGALTVCELAAAGRPSLLVPLPHAIDDHQTANARFLADRGAAELMPQGTLTSQLLADRLDSLFTQPEILQQMANHARSQAKPDATADVIRACLEVAREH
ncbi:MAG TPA: undecaprenyldiphospho-muramoylpentapeptide beta-N-acetylglucosaminyltransferase [Pseudomonas xinjiangensis]|uniref:UDP-N-acetylglucosamine--N-acetylmuramyl-(pentapeptide) pyrophosphoryl-undecaprenol N-acetylglucosamine transferase n=2 Tax=root TaxID=1 RepID=A0A7V1BP84_9GAMM|nr:undecaprenyldiphospho-muramoylpentapeptide beta-N-acetylglucosaminyltransferase [Halopseudomonas xinjiangensis]HEC48680.1 undecaprenyldiphospho-muramoylpentapeptide beta-N-acetylglucosaminyltransferase [Halopseudomonas xinjiangensis]